MNTQMFSNVKSAFFPLLPLVIITIYCVSFSQSGLSQSNFDLPEITNEGWLRPYTPVRIVNNLYYVGSYELGQFLITTDEGHILINTGPHGSVSLIRNSILSLGLNFNDIKILLTTQAHWDHVGGLAEIKRITGARMLAQKEDAPVLEDGGSSDYKFPDGREPTFEPVEVDEIINDGDVIKLGNFKLSVH
ncbi:MAG: metallo-beta-lactamase, partial [Gammaproteobacteria bacterium]|nr:metallo-beta-lactamase [Gammaproteobacteria bacterium]